MKIGVIGDTHGRNYWEKIPIHEFDKFIFIGDYFDSFDIPQSIQLFNFNNILELKRKYPDKIILLTGNHDYHYMAGVIETYSGYQQYTGYLNITPEIHKAYQAHELQMCFIYDNFIFTHAGVTKTWVKNHKVDINNLEESINHLFWGNLNHFRFAGRDAHGDDVTQSPIWVRPESLSLDKIDDYVQVVGHTHQWRINNQNGIWLTDVLNDREQYLIINNGEIELSIIG